MAAKGARSLSCQVLSKSLSVLSEAKMGFLRCGANDLSVAIVILNNSLPKEILIPAGRMMELEVLKRTKQ